MPRIRAPSGATAREPSASGVQKITMQRIAHREKTSNTYGKYISVLFLEPSLFDQETTVPDSTTKTTRMRRIVRCQMRLE